MFFFLNLKPFFNWDVFTFCTCRMLCLMSLMFSQLGKLETLHLVVYYEYEKVKLKSDSRIIVFLFVFNSSYIQFHNII